MLRHGGEQQRLPHLFIQRGNVSLGRGRVAGAVPAALVQQRLDLGVNLHLKESNAIREGEDKSSIHRPE
jgi:hypothetical protein